MRLENIARLNFKRILSLQIANLTIDFIFDIFMAYIFYILIECPFSNIFQIIFSRRPVKTSVEDNYQIKPNYS